jgi:hypothetical protein
MCGTRTCLLKCKPTTREVIASDQSSHSREYTERQWSWLFDSPEAAFQRVLNSVSLLMMVAVVLYFL